MRKSKGKNPDRPLTPRERARFKSLAARVLSNMHFACILATVPPTRRQAMYDQIAPQLRFKPQSYLLLPIPQTKWHS